MMLVVGPLFSVTWSAFLRSVDDGYGSRATPMTVPAKSRIQK